VLSPSAGRGPGCGPTGSRPGIKRLDPHTRRRGVGDPRSIASGHDERGPVVVLLDHQVRGHTRGASAPHQPTAGAACPHANRCPSRHRPAPALPATPAASPPATRHPASGNGVKPSNSSSGSAPRLSTTRTAWTSAIIDAGSAGSRPEGQAAEIAGGVLPRELDSWEQAPAVWRPPAEPRLWGPYAGAVARWEYLTGRPAPAPTQPGIHGKPVLAPPFVEWLKGLSVGSAPGRAGRHGAVPAGQGRETGVVVVPDTFGHLGLWPGPAVTPRDHGAGLAQRADPRVPSAAVRCVIPPGPTPAASDAPAGVRLGDPQRTAWKTWWRLSAAQGRVVATRRDRFQDACASRKEGVSRSGLPSTPTDEQSFRIRGIRADARPDPTGN